MPPPRCNDSRACQLNSINSTFTTQTLEQVYDNLPPIIDLDALQTTPFSADTATAGACGHFDAAGESETNKKARTGRNN